LISEINSKITQNKNQQVMLKEVVTNDIGATYEPTRKRERERNVNCKYNVV